MTRLRLPIGIQTFRTIREEGYYYVDKTPDVRRLVKDGTHYFLSRPRRFGKSLLLDTLKELFEGSEPLFRGLAIHDCWDWSVRHPVVRLSFGGGPYSSPKDVATSALAQLGALADEAGVETRHDSAPGRLADLLRQLHHGSGQRVVVLIDEYDKPILDALGTPETACANRDFLRGLYGVVKDCDAHVRFAFVTGVSKSSSVNLFSGLNNLVDITLDPTYGTVCGYTEQDLDSVFAPELDGLDRAAIHRWYNGYRWLGEQAVYNPFDILLLFRNREFEAYWFETATPTFLIETLAARGVRSVDLDGMVASASLLSTFDVDRIAPQALLFQSGYLTITGRERRGGATRYRLGYPNQEVRQSLNESLLDHLAKAPGVQSERRFRLYDLLEAGDFDGLRTLFEALFAGIPYEWHVRNDIAAYEGYYGSVVYSCFAALGLDITVEDSSSRGRLDMAVRIGGRLYLFEFKVLESSGEGAALAQLKDRDYAAKYRGSDEQIHLVGVEFSRERRSIVSFDVASD